MLLDSLTIKKTLFGLFIHPKILHYFTQIKQLIIRVRATMHQAAFVLHFLVKWMSTFFKRCYILGSVWMWLILKGDAGHSY